MYLHSSGANSTVSTSLKEEQEKRVKAERQVRLLEQKVSGELVVLNLIFMHTTFIVPQILIIVLLTVALISYLDPLFISLSLKHMMDAAA